MNIYSITTNGYCGDQEINMKESKPHIVVLDTGISWEKQEYANIQIAHKQSFCSAADARLATSHCSSMLEVLSRNLTCITRVSLGKVLSAPGVGNPQVISRGLMWSAELFPDAVVMPLGLMKPNSSVKAALEVLSNTGCRIFAAVGNPYEGQKSCLYPAAYPECISVGCTRYANVYDSWTVKPDILVEEETIASVKGIDGIHLGTSTATMLAVAEFFNNEFCGKQERKSLPESTDFFLNQRG